VGKGSGEKAIKCMLKVLLFFLAKKVFFGLLQQ